MYEVSMSTSLLGFGCPIVLLLRANMLVRNASPRGHIYVRCLMFVLSGPCKLLFFHCYIISSLT